MLTWNVTYHTKPGHRQAFYQAICDLGVREQTLQEAGNRKYDYYFDAQDDTILLLVESWETPAHQEAHTQTETFAALQDLKSQHCLEVTIDRFIH